MALSVGRSPAGKYLFRGNGWDLRPNAIIYTSLNLAKKADLKKIWQGAIISQVPLFYLFALFIIRLSFNNKLDLNKE
jgi:hypothetical protein